jgi:hypothetical protein
MAEFLQQECGKKCLPLLYTKNVYILLVNMDIFKFPKTYLSQIFFETWTQEVRFLYAKNVIGTAGISINVLLQISCKSLQAAFSC